MVLGLESWALILARALSMMRRGVVPGTNFSRCSPLTSCQAFSLRYWAYENSRQAAAEAMGG